MAFATASATGLAMGWQEELEMVLMTGLGKFPTMNQNVKSYNQLVAAMAIATVSSWGISVGAAHESNGNSKSRYQQLTNSNATASSCSISISECMQVVKATATF